MVTNQLTISSAKKIIRKTRYILQGSITVEVFKKIKHHERSYQVVFKTTERLFLAQKSVSYTGGYVLTAILLQHL